MAGTVRYRNPRVEAVERQRFRLLEHVAARTGGERGAPVLCSRVADELGLLRAEAAELFDDLVRAGYLADAGGGPSVTLTEAGALYLRRLAGRRRSVRGVRPPLAEPAGPPSLLQRVLSWRSRRAA